MSTQGPFFNQTSVQIAELALKHRLPTLSGEPRAAEAGGLLFYGPDIYEGCRRAATHVDRIFKGATPSDLPVEQPTKYELVQSQDGPGSGSDAAPGVGLPRRSGDRLRRREAE